MLGVMHTEVVAQTGDLTVAQEKSRHVAVRPPPVRWIDSSSQKPSR